MQSTDLEEIKAAIFEQAYHLCTRVSWGMAQVMAARSSKGRLLVQLWERARWYPVERVTIERPLLCPTGACDLEEGPDECSIPPERCASWHKVPMGDPRKKSKPGEVLSPRLCYTLSCQAPTCLCLSERGEGKTRLKKCPLERFVAQFFEKRSGQTEGQITRLKLLKRSMYGRAKFDLLRQRVLHRAQDNQKENKTSRIVHMYKYSLNPVH